MSSVITPSPADSILTFSGRQFWPLEPNIDDVDIIDIAHALSNLCRFGGHVRQFYSVAQHCVVVSHAVPDEHALRGLLHDASEAYLVDVPGPIKRAQSMAGYREAEHRLQAVIYERFGLPAEDPECVKTADGRLLLRELRDLMKPPPSGWDEDLATGLEETIVPCSSTVACQMFLGRFRELTAETVWV